MEVITISVERYNALVAKEMAYNQIERRLEESKEELKDKINNLYRIEARPNQLERYPDIHIVIDKINLLGLLSLNLPQDEMGNLYFEFGDRAIFLNDGWKRGR